MRQEALWLAEPDGPTARTQAQVDLTGAIDHDALQAAMATLVERHEILRTTFGHQPGIRVPLQLVNDAIAPVWETVDLSDADPDEASRRLTEIRAAELAAPLDFENGPLVRAVLVARGDVHSLILTLSGLCVDASSAALLVGELIAAASDGAEPIEDPLQYADFAAWQRELADGEDDEVRSAADFWGSWDGAASPELPFARPATGPSTPAETTVAVAPDLAHRLRAQAARYDVSVSVLVQAAWHALLARFSGDEAVVVSYVPSERRHADLDGAVGVFSRPVPIRSEVRAPDTFAALVQEIERSREQALVWQDYAPTDVATQLAIGFVAQDDIGTTGGALSASLERVTTSDPQLRLWLSCLEGADRLRLTLAFDPEFLDGEHADRLARALAELLGAVADDAGTAIGSLPILDPTERERVVVEFNATEAPRPQVSVHERFAQAAAAHPTRTAVADEHGSLTYAELDARANQLAQRLQRAGVGPDVAVGLCTDRSTDLVVGLLGILKAGGAYLPLHHEHPPARLGLQLSTAGARAIVTQEPLLTHLPEFAGEVICLDRDREALCAEPATAPAAAVTPDHLVYVIYTSGSTGTPKGVAVSHGNLANYASFLARRVGADAEALTFGAVTSISTDLGNTVVFGALCSGGTLILVSPTVAADAGALARQFTATPVDVLKITPSHVGALLSGGDGAVLPRRCLIIGGERAPWDLVSRVRDVSSTLRVINHYGPTEATVGATTYDVPDEPGPGAPASVPIGRPIDNAACYVLDDQQRPVPVGVTGRLFIAGAGVARGYLGAPELTEERFLPDPFGAAGRMYDTGDLARWLPDGTLEFLGRVDEQVKIRGYRVEPAEVESALRAHPGVRSAAVVAHTGAAGDTRLVAYCATQGGVTAAALIQHLEQWVPEFMVPAAIVLMDALPLTASGKIDRLSLPDPASLEHGSEDYLAPRSPMEDAVAGIWSRVLGLDKVGVQDDFFALGGHSLLATQVVAQVRSDFAVDLPLHSLFTYPTVESLTAEIVQMIGESDQDETAALLAELENLSDEDAERLLASEEPGQA